MRPNLGSFGNIIMHQNFKKKTFVTPSWQPHELVMSKIKSMPNVRLATWADTATMAEVAAAAFDKNDLCGRFMHPYRHQFPNDFITFWRRDIRNHFFDPDVSFLVSTIEDGSIVGTAKWKRQGKGTQKLTRGWVTCKVFSSFLILLCSQSGWCISMQKPSNSISCPVI